MSAAGLPWSPEQRRLLAAMGYALYSLRAGPSPAATATATAAAPAAMALDFDDPLFPALIRAAGVAPARPSEFDWSGWARALALPPLDELRRDPRAKRALWTRLRRWRREQRDR